MKILKVKKYDLDTENKYGFFCLKDINKEKNEFYASVSGVKLDRYNEVVLPEGMIADWYDPESKTGNPVLIDAHNYGGHAVGKVNKLIYNTENRSIDIVFEFAETESGKELKYLYENGFQRMFSIGFIPKTYLRVDKNTPKEFVLELENGNKVDINLNDYSDLPDYIFPEWELLEISTCVVGAYREALISAVSFKAEEAALKTFSNKDMAKEFIDTKVKEIRDIFETIEKVEFKGAVAKHSTPIDSDATWDGDEAEVLLAKWASSDGSGDKDKINWSKYAKGFTWFDTAKSDNFTSYKLPHHVVNDGSLVAVWRGVTAAMAALLGARGGTDVGSDFDACYNHLALHYKDAGKEPPEKSMEYTEEMLKAIEEESFETVEYEFVLEGDDTGDEGDEEDVIAIITEVFEKKFDVLQKDLLEEITTLKIKLNLILSSVKEYFDKDNKSKTDKNVKTIKEFEDIKEMFSNLVKE